MAKRKLKALRIRITHDRLEALYNICDDMQKELKPENDHERLMSEYLKELHFTIQNKLKNDQSLYTLNMSNAEATALRQLWNMLNIQHDKYACIIVRSILNEIDKIGVA